MSARRKQSHAKGAPARPEPQVNTIDHKSRCERCGWLQRTIAGRCMAYVHVRAVLAHKCETTSP